MGPDSNWWSESFAADTALSGGHAAAVAADPTQQQREETAVAPSVAGIADGEGGK